MSKTLTTLLLLAIQAADEEENYTIKHKLEEIYDNYANPVFTIDGGEFK